MRHNKAINHLGRKSGHRKALLSNMANSLILHKRITTTVAKAKALRSYVEPLVTKSKDDTTHNRRVVFSYLKNKEAVTELFRTIAPKIAERPGGYTRILHVGFRQGDAAEMALIKFVPRSQRLLLLQKQQFQQRLLLRLRLQSSILQDYLKGLTSCGRTLFVFLSWCPVRIVGLRMLGYDKFDSCTCFFKIIYLPLCKISWV